MALDPTTYMAEYEGMPISAGNTLSIPSAGGATVPALQPTRSSIMREMAYHPVTRRVAGSIVKHAKAHTLRYFQGTGECCPCPGQQPYGYPQQGHGELPPGFQTTSPNANNPPLKPFEQPQTPCSPTQDALMRAGIDPNCLRELMGRQPRSTRRRATRGRRRTVRRAGTRRGLTRRRRRVTERSQGVMTRAQYNEMARALGQPTLPVRRRFVGPTRSELMGGPRRRRRRRRVTATTRRRAPRRRRVTERSQGTMTRAEFLQMGRDMGVF